MDMVIWYNYNNSYLLINQFWLASKPSSGKSAFYALTQKETTNYIMCVSKGFV